MRTLQGDEGSSSSSELSTYSFSVIFFHLLCPSLGCLVATAMFAAPIAALRQALVEQSLGDLNPRPWAVMTGNCLGWCAYAYYIQDPFILASNIPGFILSMWLNAGAAKLQYKQMTTASRRPGSSLHRPAPLLPTSNDESNSNGENVDNDDAVDDNYYSVGMSPSPSSIIFTPQEIWWLRVMVLWSMTLVWVGWISPFPGYEASTIGLLVNFNLIFFYGVPLQTISQVVASGRCNSIHPQSMIMSIGNSSFWLLYGIALWDPVLMVPNSIGLSLGLCQLVLCMIYPRKPLFSSSMASSERPAADGAGANDDHISLTNLPSAVPPDGIFRDLQLSSRFANFRDRDAQEVEAGNDGNGN